MHSRFGQSRAVERRDRRICRVTLACYSNLQSSVYWEGDVEYSRTPYHHGSDVPSLEEPEYTVRYIQSRLGDRQIIIRRSIMSYNATTIAKHVPNPPGRRSVLRARAYMLTYSADFMREGSDLDREGASSCCTHPNIHVHTDIPASIPASMPASTPAYAGRYMWYSEGVEGNRGSAWHF